MASYICSNCGARLLPAQNRCRQCGSEIAWEEAVARVRYIQRISEPRSSRWPRFILLSAALSAVLGAVLLFAFWGLRSFWVESGLDGETVVVVQPPPASAPGVAVTPTPSLSEHLLEKALSRAQASIDRGDWSKALEELAYLQNMSVDYQAGLVAEMRFTAYWNLAQTAARSGDLDAALDALAQALALRPEDAAARELRRTIHLYRQGLEARGRDWETAIGAFTELFATAPDFLDVADQLYLAYLDSADAVRFSQPCLALERYQHALQLQANPQTRAKLEDARWRCQQQDGANAVGPGPGARGGPLEVAAAGAFLYTYFDDVRTVHHTRIWSPDEGFGPIIAEESLQPDMGPNGAIAVRSTAVEHPGIALYAAPGASPRRLTKEPGDSQPRWSPDGRTILFNSDGRTPDQKTHLFLIDLSTRAVQDLGPGRGGDWSPDGRRIVYQGCDDTGEPCGLWIFDLENATKRQLTTVETDSRPAWSPDGRFVAFMSAGRSPGWDIFVVDVETGEITLFALGEANDGLPVWSPNGREIAFLSDREGDWAVYLWSLDDLSVRRLFAIPGALPVWQEAGFAWTP
ncbi:MAG: hypothetical protein GXP42_19355 [Chloroflexi bacterium]|nr:hypothetical protein [Chloroflexota bacterium]